MTVISEYQALPKRVTTLIPKGQTHCCHFSTWLNLIIHNRILNCPPGSAWRPAADRHLVYGSCMQWWHIPKKRRLVLLISFWITFSTMEKQGTEWAKGWGAGEQRRLLSLHSPPQFWSKQGGWLSQSKKTCSSLALRVPHLRDLPNCGSNPMLWKKGGGVQIKIKREAKTFKKCACILEVFRWASPKGEKTLPTNSQWHRQKHYPQRP